MADLGSSIGGIAGGVASGGITSAVTSVADAVTIITKLIYANAHPSQQKQLAERQAYHADRVNQFSKSALAGDMASCRNLWRGVVPLYSTGLSDDDVNKLSSVAVQGLNAYEWLGQFDCAESAEFLKEAVAIIETNKDTSGS